MPLPAVLSAPAAWPLRRLALLVGAAGTLALVLLDALVRDEPVPQDDDLIYERMAQDPLGTHTFVFAYRIAVPWLVYALPFDTTVSFSVLAWVMSGAAGAVLLVLLERLAIPRRISVPLAIVLVLSPPLLVASIRQGRNPDPMTILVMVTGALFVVERRPVALGVTVLVGAFNRETALFLAPFAYAVWAERPVDLRVARQVAVLALPAVAAYVALRLAIPTVGREQVLGYGSFWGGREEVLRAAADQPLALVRRVFTTFGPLWFAAPFALLGFRFARRGLVLLGLCVLSFLFALDWGRIVFVAAPVVYAAAAWTLDRYPRAYAPVLAGCALLVVGYAVYMQAVGVQNLIDAGPTPYPVR